MEDTTQVEYDGSWWQEWPLPEELREALLDACGGDDADAEAYAAYFREFADKDVPYTADRIASAGSGALARTFNSWEEVGDDWFEQAGDTHVIDILRGVADDEETTMLDQLIKQVGLQYGKRDSEWFYESGLLADGLIYCFNRP